MPRALAHGFDRGPVGAEGEGAFVARGPDPRAEAVVGGCWQGCQGLKPMAIDRGPVGADEGISQHQNAPAWNARDGEQGSATLG